jgi:hypothetical protein
MFEKYGSVNDFWMNAIKSVAIVTFSETSLATGLFSSLARLWHFSSRTLSIAAREAVHGAVWPPGTGLALHADYLSSSEADHIKNPSGSLPEFVRSPFLILPC